MRRSATLTALLLTAILAPTTALAVDPPKFTRVFGKEIPTGPYKHPACLTELDNGDLYLVYYGGQGEYANDTAVFGSRLKKGETKWSTPVEVARDPFRSLGNGVIWQSPDGLVWLFYVARFGPTWSNSRIQVKVSKDRAETWSDASLLAPEEGMMVRNRPIVLANGEYLLPVYKEVGDDPESVGAGSTSAFLLYNPKTRTWREGGRIKSAKGNIQPAVVQLPDGKLIAYCRRGGDYGQNTKGFIVRAESTDNGLTWTEGQDTKFPNPNAAVDFVRLANGHLLLVYNKSFRGRSPLTLAISTDEDKTYAFERNLLEPPGDYGYPIAFQARDGKIHVVYTSEKRSVVNHVVLDEEWITK